MIVVHTDGVRTIVRWRHGRERGIEPIIIGIERELRRVITGNFDGGTDRVIHFHGWIRSVLVVGVKRRLVIIDQSGIRRLREEFLNCQRDGIEPARRDDAVGEQIADEGAVGRLVSRARIVNAELGNGAA